MKAVGSVLDASSIADGCSCPVSAERVGLHSAEQLGSATCGNVEPA